MRSTPLWRAFGFALTGIAVVARTQRNMRLHLAAAGIVLAAALAVRLPGPDAIGVVLAIALVLACELLNTAIEAALDLLSPGFHPLAKLAKDAAAGAVLVAAVSAVVVGVLAFRDGLGAARASPCGPSPVCYNGAGLSTESPSSADDGPSAGAPSR